MKFKATEDFKKAARGIVLYLIIAIMVFPVYHLIKGDFCWSDTLINAGLMIGVAALLGVFYFLGMQIPDKNKKEK